MTNSEVCFRKIMWAAVLREEPKGEQLEKGSSGEKLFGNKGSASSNRERCEANQRRNGEQEAFGGKFHFACVAFKVTSKHPGGNLLEDIK